MTIETIEDLPFVERDPLELLGLDRDRQTPDHDFYGFGWGRLSLVTLEDAAGGHRMVFRPLVLALHNADDPPQPGRGLDIEFELDVDGEDVSFVVSLVRVLDTMLRPLLGQESDVVLALCNPWAVPVARPAWLEHRRLHVAHGDVHSWLDDPDGPSPRVRLTADSWHTLSQPQPGAR